MQPIDFIMIVAAYISGSIPFGSIVYFLLNKEDIRKHGSGNIGATNVARNAGKRAGITTLLLDIVKGFLPVMACFWFGLELNEWTPALVAIAAVLGHMFPVWLKFKGGKGGATAVGTYITMAWPILLMAAAVFFTTFGITRIVSLSTMIGVILYSAMTFVFGSYFNIPFTYQIASVVLAILIIGKHYQNIIRLVKGEEKGLKPGKKDK